MIFYFTATGNSLFVAQRLVDSFREEAVSIVEALKGDCTYDIADGEKIGIVTPVYFYGLPTITEDFIRKVRFNGKPRVYIVLTYGTFTATTSRQAGRLLSDAGLSMDYAFSVRMPENYTPLMNVPDKETEKKILAAADTRIAEIIASLESGDEGDHDDGKGSFPSLITAFSRPFYRYGRSTRRFYTTGKCTGCGMCSRICPVGAIEMIDRIPTWSKGRCLRCLACLHRCPSKAIEFGHATVGKARYVNPNVHFPKQ